jgi:putative two-component system hydrogenase maturation factor HypX/HoxX
VKLPATEALADLLVDVPQLVEPAGPTGHQEISYRRLGDVGELRFDFYNGAMSTAQCRRLVAALRRAIAQDAKVLVVGGGESFSNGIHLNVIHAAGDPAGEAWRNIVAIDDVCREIIMCTDKLVVSSVSGNAGAGGVMAALGADRVVLREGVVLNPHYKTMGLFGSEYWTYVLPRRVGHDLSRQLTEQCLPIGSTEALAIGLADDVLSGSPTEFAAAILDYAAKLAADDNFDQMLEAKRAARAADESRRPLEAYRVQELAEMSRDIFDDRNGFAAARYAFVTKPKASGTPAHLLAPPTLRVESVPQGNEAGATLYSRTGT